MNYIEWLAYFCDLNKDVEFFTTGEAVKHCTFSRQTVYKYITKFYKSAFLIRVGRGKWRINQSHPIIVSIRMEKMF